MGYVHLFAFMLVFLPVALHGEEGPKPSLCDSDQKIPINITTAIESSVLKELKAKGVQELNLMPVMDFAWTKSFPLKEGASVTLKDTADLLTTDVQMGLVVTYKKGEEEILYAYCQVDLEDLKGEFPKDLKIHLSPILHNCKIDVVSTQCPKKKP
jgi:hypothetical protein